MRFKAITINRAPLRRPDLDQVFDDLEVFGVEGQQGCSVNVGRRCDRQVGEALSRSAAPLSDGSLQPAPLSGCDVIEGQWVGEARLDQSQPTRPLRSCRLVRDEQSEVQLCERDDADRDLGLCRDLAGDQDGGIEE